MTVEGPAGPLVMDQRTHPVMTGGRREPSAGEACGERRNAACDRTGGGAERGEPARRLAIGRGAQVAARAQDDRAIGGGEGGDELATLLLDGLVGEWQCAVGEAPVGVAEQGVGAWRGGQLPL